MVSNKPIEKNAEIVEQFKEQVRDENFILRLEQMKEQNIYECFQAFQQYNQIYR